MNEYLSNALIAFFVCAAVAVGISFWGQSVQNADRLEAKSKQVCIENGGSWLYSSCILPETP